VDGKLLLWMYCGNGSESTVNGLDVDANNNVYVALAYTSSDFILAGSVMPKPNPNTTKPQMAPPCLCRVNFHRRRL
jgi:hypothetical protein